MPNVAPPTGWQLNSFDDSTWAHPAGAIGDPSLIWAEIPAFSNQEENLFRRPFQMPSGIAVFSATLLVQGQSLWMEVYVNGHAVPNLPAPNGLGTPLTSIDFPPAWLILGGDNLLAVRASATGAAPQFQSPPEPSVFYQITYTT